MSGGVDAKEEDLRCDAEVLMNQEEHERGMMGKGS